MEPSATTRHERDPYERARAFLAGADLRPEFAARALARIEGQHHELGDDLFRQAALGELVSECAREGEALVAWAADLAARLEEESGGSFAGRGARALLTGATQRQGEVDTLLCELRLLVERTS
jgi:hypothetical protein